MCVRYWKHDSQPGSIWFCTSARHSGSGSTPGVLVYPSCSMTRPSRTRVTFTPSTVSVSVGPNR